MSFTFDPRTLLELGKELISSDEVALYELIKNAIDAKSARVEISARVLFTPSDAAEAKSLLTGQPAGREVALHKLTALFTTPDHEDAARLVTELRKAGNDAAFTTALDGAHARLNWIRVRDTGDGMSLDDLDKVFLRVGTRSRHDENLKGARNLGDKGIGRLSAMRLGDRLRVTTSKAGEMRWNELAIDWTLFATASERAVEDIKVDPALGEEKHRPEESGTTIEISGLLADWDQVRFADVLQGRIARMIDPFEPGLANRLIIARHNGTRILVPSIPEKLLDSAHAVCRVEFRMEKGEPVLDGRVDYRFRQRSALIEAKGPELFSLTQTAFKRRAKRGHAAFRNVPLPASAFHALNRFSCEIYWFNRRVVEAVDGLSTSMQETRREISHWSGGPMLFRYGYRILPYGDPDDDWLELDENAFGAKGFKLNRQQVIGRVRLDTPHGVLSEQTNREGLIQSEVVDALRKMLMWVVHDQVRGLINEADEIELIERRAADQDTRRVSDTRRRVEVALDRLRQLTGGEASDAVAELSRGVAQLSDQSAGLVKRLEEVLTEAEEDREKFVYLAGIGLMTEFIFHELERAVAHTMDLLSGGSLRRATIDSLREQLKTLHKRIAAFDELSGEKRQSKTTFDLAELVDEVLSNHANEFARHGVLIEFERPDRPYPVKAVRGMVIQILENLVVNAAYWLKQQKRFEPDFTPALHLTLSATDSSLTVEDNGPGITEDRKERVFQPFVTTKPVGQGRGLGLYIARELAAYHGWRLHLDATVGRRRSGRINMFVLDMG